MGLVDNIFHGFFITNFITIAFLEPSPLLAPSTPQTLALQQDSVTEESTSKTVSQPPKPTEDRSSDSETPSNKYHCY